MKMVLRFLCLLFISWTPLQTSLLHAGQTELDDIYLIFYLSRDGRTGHLGLAIDNYDVLVLDRVIDGREITVYDTVRNYALTYFDLWGPPEIDLDQHNQNLPGRYYRLPRTTAEPKINVEYFLRKGLPHAYDYPCDALLRIRTSPSMDYEMIRIADELQKQFNFFNTRYYNCVDYIIQCLNKLFDVNIEAKEYIPFTWSSTPNKLYRNIDSYLDVVVVKDAGHLANRSFFRERIFKSLFYTQNSQNEEIY